MDATSPPLEPEVPPATKRIKLSTKHPGKLAVEDLATGSEEPLEFPTWAGTPHAQAVENAITVLNHMISTCVEHASEYGNHVRSEVRQARGYDLDPEETKLVAGAVQCGLLAILRLSHTLRNLADEADRDLRDLGLHDVKEIAQTVSTQAADDQKAGELHPPAAELDLDLTRSACIIGCRSIIFHHQQSRLKELAMFSSTCIIGREQVMALLKDQLHSFAEFERFLQCEKGDGPNDGTIKKRRRLEPAPGCEIEELPSSDEPRPLGMPASPGYGSDSPSYEPN